MGCSLLCGLLCTCPIQAVSQMRDAQLIHVNLLQSRLIQHIHTFPTVPETADLLQSIQFSASSNLLPFKSFKIREYKK
jgi:hypothetical protein